MKTLKQGTACLLVILLLNPPSGYADPFTYDPTADQSPPVAVTETPSSEPPVEETNTNNNEEAGPLSAPTNPAENNTSNDAPSNLATGLVRQFDFDGNATD